MVCTCAGRIAPLYLSLGSCVGTGLAYTVFTEELDLLSWYGIR